jgi:chromosome segregation ATPase
MFDFIHAHSPVTYLAAHPGILAIAATLGGVAITAAGAKIYGLLNPSVSADERAKHWEEKFLASESLLNGAKADLDSSKLALDSWVKNYWQVADESTDRLTKIEVLQNELDQFRDLERRFGDKVFVEVGDYNELAHTVAATEKDRDALAEWYNAEFEEVTRLKKELAEVNDFLEELCADYESDLAEKDSLVSSLKDNLQKKEDLIKALTPTYVNTAPVYSKSSKPRTSIPGNTYLSDFPIFINTDPLGYFNPNSGSTIFYN